MKIQNLKYPVLLALLLAGLGVSAYLSWEHAQGVLPPCTIRAGCEVVLTSRYSNLLGVPVAYLGLAYFVTAAGLCLAAWRGTGRRLLPWLLGTGFCVGLVLVGLQLFVIRKVCQYCAAVDSASILAFLWALNVGDPEPVLQLGKD